MDSPFSRQAELYARYRPTYPDSLYEFILEQLPRKHTAWDCATGSGQVAVMLASYFYRVYANDISRHQMKFAPDDERIRYFNVPAENTGFPSDLFDLVTVAQAIHWFDIERFYREVVRTTKTPALIAVFGYGRIRVGPDMDQLIDRFYDTVFGRYYTEIRKLVDEHYRTIPFPFDEIPSPSFQIKMDWNRQALVGYLNSWSAVQKIKSNDGYNPVSVWLKKIEPFWKPEEKRTVVFPVFLRLGRISQK